jgi:polar amino acid transport system substrate-binding protein
MSLTPLRSLPSLVALLMFATTACSEGGSADRVVAQAQTTVPAAAPEGPCRLTLGWDPAEPYQYRNAEGTVEGLDIELARAIFEAAKCDTELSEGRWATLVRRVQRGDIDVLAGALRTPARESFALFSAPYRNETIVLYVRKGDAAVRRSTSLQALLDTGFRLGVREQYAYGDTVDALQENPQYADHFVGATSAQQNSQRLLDVEIDGFLEDPVAAQVMMRKQGLQEEIEAHPLTIHSGSVALMFSRATVDEALVARIDAALAQLRTSGRYQTILDKYAN